MTEAVTAAKVPAAVDAGAGRTSVGFASNRGDRQGLCVGGHRSP
jgi:hypothetical protein